MNKDIKKAVFMINNQEVECFDFNITGQDELQKQLNEAEEKLLSFPKTTTITLKINRWNRFKLWLMFLKEKLKNIKTYEIKIKG